VHITEGFVRINGKLKVEVPNRFWDDHRDRECSPSAVEVKRKSRTTTVLLDEAAEADLHSDADYYSDEAVIAAFEGDKSLIGLAMSARATMRAIRKAKIAAGELDS
jgi:adenosylcobinamide amidohydrolase